MILEDGVKTIGDCAFVNSAVYHLTIPNSVTSIAKTAFNTDHDEFYPHITCKKDSLAYQIANELDLGLWVTLIE